MKVLCVQGSPRKQGNSATIARRFLKVAEDRGATTETYILNELDFKPCQACYACKTKLDRCALNDDIFQRYGGLFKTYAGVDTHLIRGTGVEAPGEVKDKPELMAQADEMAQKLVKGNGGNDDQMHATG